MIVITMNGKMQYKCDPTPRQYPLQKGYGFLDVNLKRILEG